MTTPAEGWAAKTNSVVAVAGALFVMASTIATVAMYQGRIEERVVQVDKKLERMEAKLDLIAPPTVKLPINVGNTCTGESCPVASNP